VATARPAEPAATRRELDREWWRHTLRVLRDPVASFAALRDDDSEEAVEARQEPMLALVWLAGIALVLDTNAAAHLLDDFEITGILIAIWALFAGGIYGAVGYFVVGALVLLGLELAGGVETYRRARHLLGLAGVPLALGLLVWPFRLAIYGGDVFRAGGSDRGTGNAVFEGLELAFVGWSLALLVVGLRTTQGWTWGRAAASASIPALVPALALLRAYGAI
jgi:hypothetical protein